MMFATYYPHNVPVAVPCTAVYAGLFGSTDNYYYPTVATSLHPGGANFAFADGSVRFLKETISCWPANPTGGNPIGITDTAGVYTMNPSQIRPSVYQALSTRAGGEVISADSY